MEKIPSLVSFASLLIIFASVVHQTRAGICNDNLGLCKNCDDRCKAKHGPSCESKCDGPVGMLLCTCTYECPPKLCNSGLGNCGVPCPDKCCDANCAKKYNGGHGSCKTLDSFSMCLCQYPC